ncbi:hypothetical protein CLU82_2151 [Flavobacterium sp. 5]|nr:hypothetical protein CLU82_2151 [Flavobacterium sp. 5]
MELFLVNKVPAVHYIFYTEKIEIKKMPFPSGIKRGVAFLKILQN